MLSLGTPKWNEGASGQDKVRQMCPIQDFLRNKIKGGRKHVRKLYTTTSRGRCTFYNQMLAHTLPNYSYDCLRCDVITAWKNPQAWCHIAALRIHTSQTKGGTERLHGFPGASEYFTGNSSHIHFRISNSHVYVYRMTSA